MEASTPSLTYAAQGRHAVGYREFTTVGAQQQPLTLRAWYPARRPDDKRPATINYAAPNKFDEQITPGKQITAVGGALANGRPDGTGGPYPLVVFSHGYALSPIVHSTLVEHYASQGYIVLAPEHNETFEGSPDEVPSGLWPSFGDPRVTSAISLAGDAYLFDQRGLAELEVPIMVMGGTIDEGTPYTWGAKPTYDHVGSEDKTFVSFPGASHFLFVDSCENLPWVENSVYRDALCTDAVWGTHRPLDIVTHYTTAFLRDTLDTDPEARATLTGQQPDLDNVEYTTTNIPDMRSATTEAVSS